MNNYPLLRGSFYRRHDVPLIDGTMHTIANAGGYDELYPRYRGNYNYSLTERLSWSEKIKRDMAMDNGALQATKCA